MKSPTFLDELTALDLTTLSPAFLQKTKFFLQGVQKRLLSQDPKEQQEALYEMLEMRSIIQEKKQTLQEKLGLSSAELETLSQERSEIPEELSGALEELEEFV